ncbi:MAG: methyltransferase [Flavobacteriales bacterium]
MYENNFPKKRFRITLEFLKQFVSKDDRILDLGIINPFSDILKKEGFHVTNTEGEDLDLDTTIVKKDEFDVVTAFQIFEHMIAPFNVLNDVKATKLIASVPLKLWFSSAYRSKTDKWDRHYHEFEDWQFNWLLEKSGWEVKKSIQFTSPVKKIGFRPILRLFTPRFYLVYAEKIKS